MQGQGSGSDVHDENRAILLTPPGGAAIAVVRLVGERVGAFLRENFSRPVPEGRCVHGTLAEGGRVLAAPGGVVAAGGEGGGGRDAPGVVVWGGGRGAEVTRQGGRWVVRSVLELARREGFAV